MLRFFRQIRQRLITHNPPDQARRAGKFSKYLLYALGEIALVVIGILIALQIDNWNESQKMEGRERNLLRELKTNLETNVKNLESDISVQVNGASSIQYLLDHLDHRRSYTDTLDYLFQNADFAPDVVLSSSAFEMLKSAGLEIIHNDSLRKGVIELFEIKYPFLMQETRRLEDLIWPTASVALYQKYFRREIPGKAHPIDYEKLLEDTEFTNMLSFRLLLRKQSTLHKRKAVEETKKVIQLIAEQLE